MIVTIYEATPVGKEPVGKIESRNGKLRASGAIGPLVKDLKSGDLKVIIVDKTYTWDDGEEFLQALPMALHGSYLWAELTDADSS